MSWWKQISLLRKRRGFSKILRLQKELPPMYNQKRLKMIRPLRLKMIHQLSKILNQMTQRRQINHRMKPNRVMRQTKAETNNKINHLLVVEARNTCKFLCILCVPMEHLPKTMTATTFNSTMRIKLLAQIWL